MELVRWSRDELCELVQGRNVFVRDPSAGGLPVPDWLLDTADSVWSLDSAASLEATHPDDRMAVVETFLAALEQPGVPQRADVRENIDGVWFDVEIGWLNLLHDEDVGGVLGTRLLKGPSPRLAEDPHRAGEAGEREETAWVLLELNRSGSVVSARGRVAEILGWAPADLTGRSLAALVPPDDLVESLAAWVQIQADPAATRVSRRRVRRADQSEVWVESSYLHDLDTGNVLCVMIDISRRVVRERELRELTDQLSVIADALPTAVVRCDREGNVLFHNARWAELVDTEDGPTRLHEIVADADLTRLDAALRAACRIPARERRVLEVAATCGRAMWEITLQPIGPPSDSRTIVASIEDATDTVQLRRAARHDGLTGVLNRSAVEEQLRAALEDDPEGTLVVFLDLDAFKAINDVHGHEAGDQVLQAIAGRLRSAVRPGDDVGRYGGDEFVLVCRGIAGGAEADLVDRLSTGLADPVAFPGGRCTPTASIGWARAEPGDDLADVLRRADQAMFAIKRERR